MTIYNIIKKYLTIIISFFLVVSFHIDTVKAVDTNDFTYYVENDEVTITGYNGSAVDLVFPDTIEDKPVTKIEGDGYLGKYNNYLLNSIILPSNLKVIGDHAFNSCINLKNISMPDSVEEIGDSAFYWCSGLEEIKFSSNLKVIGSGAFDMCLNLKTFVLPESLETLDSFAFSRCKSLNKVTLPEGVKTIGGSAFRQCEGLTEINIPQNVSWMGECVFSECYNLETIDVSPDNPYFRNINGVLCDNERVICLPIRNQCSSVVIPEGIKTIDQNAFANNAYIQTIHLPDSLMSIGTLAFENCTSLETINIPKNINMLYESKVPEDDLGERMINYYVFMGCTMLHNITLDPENTTYIIEDGAFYKKDYSMLIKLLDRNTTAFQARPETKIIIPEAFYSCNKLEDIDLNHVKEIGERAFGQCSSLEKIQFDEVTDIGYSAFFECTALKSIRIPDGITDLSGNMFDNCTSLEYLDLNKVENFSNYAVTGCVNLKKLVIPKTVKYMYLYYSSDSPESDLDLTYFVYNDSDALEYIESVNQHIEAGEHWFGEKKYKYQIIQELNNSDTDVQVDTGTITNIDDNAQLKVQHLSDGDQYDFVANDFDNFDLYDISFVKDNTSIEVDGIATVKLPVSQNMNQEQCKVYYLNENNEYVDMHAKYEAGYMIFQTNHFSYYLITDCNINSVQLGDVNHNGTIDFNDAILILKSDSGLLQLTDSQIKVSDTNHDGFVNYNDAIQILKYDSGLISDFN